MKKDFILKKMITRVGAVGLIYLTSTSSGFSQEAGSDPLPQYLQNFGSYFGYDLTKTPQTPVNTLLDGDGKSVHAIQKTDLLLSLGTIFHKIIVDPTSGSPLTVLNRNQSATGGYNNSYVLQNPPYNVPAQSGTLSVNALIDQMPYQNNPVSQTILDMLTTPDFSFCSIVPSCTSGSTTKGDLTSKCCGSPAKYQSQIGLNVLGNSFPDPTNLESLFTLDPSVIKQLNSNALIGPLLYSTSNASNQSNSSGNAASTPVGLTAVGEAQEAANFIRYASAVVAPPTQTNLATYQILYNQAMGLPAPVAPATTAAITRTANAQQLLATYLAGLRTVAAQTSVGVANLYEILSKRIPQSPDGSKASTSQALNEYYMATRRLYDPTLSKGGQSPQWLDQINTASPATIQKEIAVLLSEINYQLYLSRQQQERLLLTNSVMIFQLAHSVQPQPLQPPQ